MKKRLNRMAVALWFIAALYFVAKLSTLVVTTSFALKFAGIATDDSTLRPLLRTMGTVLDANAYLETITDAIFDTAQLVGLGALIEIVDRIRWQARPPDTAQVLKL